jgi:putative ABC transport system permease protein
MVVFIIVIMGLVNTMSTAVLERTREIGILRAVGWSKHRIAKLILLESIAYGLFGGIIGIILGYSLMRILIVAPQVQGFIAMSYDLSFMIRTLGLSLFVGIIAGVYPAVKAISIEPIDVLRYE